MALDYKYDIFNLRKPRSMVTLINESWNNSTIGGLFQVNIIYTGMFQNMTYQHKKPDLSILIRVKL